MNSSMIRFILGSVLEIEALLLFLPCLVALIYQEYTGMYYLVTACVCGLIGLALSAKKPASNVFYLKEGCVATALSWIFMSIFGAVPFVLSGEIPSFTDALFETISGFTTTGASILSNVEALSHTSLFWRSFTHWIGGMGVLVFLLAIIPLSGGSNINLMRAESPGPSVGKLVPKMKHTARILYCIYIGLTVCEMILLLLCKMPVFDAVTLSFGTTGTGGFGVLNDSIMSYNAACQWIITLFMILSSINFNAYYFILFKEFKKAFGMEEVRCFLIIIAVSVGIIFFDILSIFGNAFDALTHSAFQVASIISSTGFATTDFNVWPQTSRTILVLLMMIGACAGSTGGGIKISRFVILVKSVFKELNGYLHPKSVKKIKMDGKAIEHEVVRATNVYFITFFILFSLSVFLLSFEGKDLVTNFTAVAATINNIGPGLELVGPTQNFGTFNVFSKYVLMFDMLAGRLELFPILILFIPTIWKDMLTKKVGERRKDRQSVE